MTVNPSAFGELALDSVLDDRSDSGIFRVDRRAFTDRPLFQLEMSRIFEATWIFIGLESEVEHPHDYVTRQIGRRPVILMRDKGGRLGCFLNSCRHRGTLLCPLGKGNQKFHTCPYHGWVYDSGGRNVGITGQGDGQYPASFAAQDHSLVPIAKLDSYRGFIFASLSPQVPPLREHLGDAARMLDLVADQAPHGLEYVPGPISYTFDGNWKLQFENGLDAYHFPSTHAAFVNILRQRGATEPRQATAQKEALGAVAAGTLNFIHGHSASWSIGVPGQGPERRPLTRDPQLFATVRRNIGEARLDWMLRQRNLNIFPNLQVIDIQSLQVRTWQPLAVDKTRMTSHCLAPKGESAEARAFRIRQYEEFFNAGGLATSDDNIMYELNQAGLAAVGAQGDAYARGLAATSADPEYFAALGLEHAACTHSSAGLAFGDESAIRNGYREWRRLMIER